MPAFYRRRRTYKYTLDTPYQLLTPLRPLEAVGNGFLRLHPDGTLAIAAHYSWDGASGPMPDLPSIVRGSLVHDALYQLIREGALAAKPHRREADQLLRSLCLADGMSYLLAQWVYLCVRVFGGLFVRSPQRALRNT
ncbi:hypothetical protein [Chitinibacter tainanensis]|uniref:hypothetical protein n=1 Tax=Chitinibacter tainanensis TaxID=230667 RepID=UPI0023551246|nr:hypothetical protein [Chitinibacter tainanensis]